MKKALVILVCLPLVVFSGVAKSKKPATLVASADPQALLPSNKDQESGLLLRKVGSPFDICAGMRLRDSYTVGLLLKITNASAKPLVFAPSEIVVILPNGHSYRPFSQTDVLQEAYEVEAGARSESVAEETPTLSAKRASVSEAGYASSCSVRGDSAACSTTADVSTERWRARRVALRYMTRAVLQDVKLKRYVRAVREQYLAAQKLAPGATASGYVDIYVENVRQGPFTVRVPAGGTNWIAPAPGELAVPVSAYNFSFGPEIR
ncbi:MAG: hypothetical protein ACXVZR_00195 [Terriglobales bacterium]